MVCHTPRITKPFDQRAFKPLDFAQSTFPSVLCALSEVEGSFFSRCKFVLGILDSMILGANAGGKFEDQYD